MARYWAYTVFVKDAANNSSMGQGETESEATHKAEANVRSFTTHRGPIRVTEVRHIDPDTGVNLGTQYY